MRSKKVKFTVLCGIFVFTSFSFFIPGMQALGRYSKRGNRCVEIALLVAVLMQITLLSLGDEEGGPEDDGEAICNMLCYVCVCDCFFLHFV
jgi:hypothetical protein